MTTSSPRSAGSGRARSPPATTIGTRGRQLVKRMPLISLRRRPAAGGSGRSTPERPRAGLFVVPIRRVRSEGQDGARQLEPRRVVEELVRRVLAPRREPVEEANGTERGSPTRGDP